MAKNEHLRNEWNERIAEFRKSGLTMSAWCTANQVTIHQLKYWLYKAKSSPSTPLPRPASSSHFVPLAVVEQASSPASPLVVRVGQATIELHTGFDRNLFREVMQALQTLC